MPWVIIASWGIAAIRWVHNFSHPSAFRKLGSYMSKSPSVRVTECSDEELYLP